MFSVILRLRCTGSQYDKCKVLVLEVILVKGNMGQRNNIIPLGGQEIIADVCYSKNLLSMGGSIKFVQTGVYIDCSALLLSLANNYFTN